MVTMRVLSSGRSYKSVEGSVDLKKKDPCESVAWAL